MEQEYSGTTNLGQLELVPLSLYIPFVNITLGLDFGSPEDLA